MQELIMTPATAVILIALAAWAAWAVRRLFFRGLCDCHGDGKKPKAGACATYTACHGCSRCETKGHP